MISIARQVLQSDWLAGRALGSHLPWDPRAIRLHFLGDYRPRDALCASSTDAARRVLGSAPYIMRPPWMQAFGSSSASRWWGGYTSAELLSRLPDFEHPVFLSLSLSLLSFPRREIVRRSEIVISIRRSWNRCETGHVSSCAATRTIDVVFYGTRDRPGLSSLLHRCYWCWLLDACLHRDTWYTDP